jgi:hypothetical protein
MRELAEESTNSAPARAELNGVSPGDLDTHRGAQAGMGLQNSRAIGRARRGPEGPGWPALHSGVAALTLVTSIEGLLR